MHLLLSLPCAASLALPCYTEHVLASKLDTLQCVCCMINPRTRDYSPFAQCSRVSILGFAREGYSSCVCVSVCHTCYTSMTALETCMDMPSESSAGIACSTSVEQCERKKGQQYYSLAEEAEDSKGNVEKEERSGDSSG